MTASVPKIVAMYPCSLPAATIAATMVMPEIALEPDINGVWSCEGTLEINSKPKKIAKTKIKNRMTIIYSPKDYKRFRLELYLRA